MKAARGLATAAVLAALAAGCGEPEPLTLPPPPPRTTAELVEVRVLGDRPGADGDELLGLPRGVRTDDDGNVYVVDRIAAAIKVYDAGGNYLRRIGRRGRGEGEMVDVSCMERTRDGELLVADGMTGRITRFADDGEVLATYPMDERFMLWPRSLRQLPGDRFLFLYKLPRKKPDGYRRRHAGELFHLYPRDFSDKLARFGSFADLTGDDGRIADRLMQLHPGSVHIDPDGSVLYAPGLYRGQILRYREEGGSWSRTATLQGYVADLRTFVRADSDRLAREQPTFRINSRQGTFIGYYNNQSRGLYRLRDGRLVHFTLVAEDLGRTLGVEIFDADDTLRAFAPLIRVTPRVGQPTTVPIHVEWKDAEDRFYIRVTEADRPLLKVVRLEIGNPLPEPGEDTAGPEATPASVPDP